MDLGSLNKNIWLGKAWDLQRNSLTIMLPQETSPMSQPPNTADAKSQTASMGSLLLGTGFALASLILIPAVAQRTGLGSALTSALRVTLMKASQKA